MAFPLKINTRVVPHDVHVDLLRIAFSILHPSPMMSLAPKLPGPHLKIPSSSLPDLKHQTADPEPLNQPPPRQPGISFFYGGLVHRHTVISILMQCITSMALTSIVWAVWGFSLAFGESGGGFMGSPSSYPFFSNLSPCTPLGYPMVMIPRKTS